MNYISFTNTDNKCVSFGKDTNIINKISFQKNPRNSFCPSLTNPNNFLTSQSKRNSSQSNTLKTKRNTFNKMNSLLYQCSNLKSGTCASSKKKSTRISKRSIQNIRIEYLKKLKRKIKYLRKSKNYYKDLFIKQFTGNENIKIKKSNSLGSFDLKEKKENDNPINKRPESSKNFPEISISSNEDTSSFSRTRIFNSDDISISNQINFTINAKYQNLYNYTLGAYAQNRNLRKSTLKFIKFYMSNFPTRKMENYFETLFSSIKSFKTSSIEKELFVSSKYSQENKSNNNNNDQKKSIVSYSPKTKRVNLNEKQYLIVYDAIKNSFELIQKKQNSRRINKKRKYSNALTNYSQRKRNNENNICVSKMPAKSLFSINKLSRNDILKNDDTILEWENELKYYNYLDTYRNANKTKNIDDYK